jgi:8-oxo-dGTP pyrophosphatase MutT (NUDIX family)
VPQAAVAAVFRPLGLETDGLAGADIELLFIQRATRAGDPWSGQMAFPGGRRDPIDPSLQATAMRETVEEVGLDLAPARYLGSLGRQDGGRATNRRIVVSAHAYWLAGPRPELQPNHEVAATVWVPLRHLGDRDRHIEYRYVHPDRENPGREQGLGAEVLFPGIRLDGADQVIWGLTLRFVRELFDRLGRPLVVG